MCSLSTARTIIICFHVFITVISIHGYSLGYHNIKKSVNIQYPVHYTYNTGKHGLFTKGSRMDNLLKSHPLSSHIHRTSLLVSKNHYHKESYRTIIALGELLRIQNIIPTILLNLLGGIMQKKGWKHLISIDMMKANMISVCIAFASCVINDIIDIDVDKLNSPNNPLADGRTNVLMAYILTFSFFILPYWLSRSMSSPTVSYLTKSSIVLLLLYTPIMKKIMVIKNLTCSFVIANTILLAATCFQTNTQHIFNTVRPFDMVKKWCITFNLCTTSTKLVYMSLFTRIFSRELEFDIRDIKGDTAMYIYTIPVVYGVDVSKRIVQICEWVWKALFGIGLMVWASS